MQSYMCYLKSFQQLGIGLNLVVLENKLIPLLYDNPSNTTRQFPRLHYNQQQPSQTPLFKAKQPLPFPILPLMLLLKGCVTLVPTLGYIISFFPPFAQILLSQGSVHLFCEEPNSKDFWLCRSHSVITTQLCHCSVKAATDNT